MGRKCHANALTQAVFMEHVRTRARKNKVQVEAGYYTKAAMAKELGWSKPGPNITLMKTKHIQYCLYDGVGYLMQ